MIEDSQPMEEPKQTNPSANGGRGLLIKVFTPARDQNEWEFRYWDNEKWEGLQDANFNYNWPVGELVFENEEILTHESAIETQTPRIEDGWVELPETYGDVAVK